MKFILAGIVALSACADVHARDAGTMPIWYSDGGVVSGTTSTFPASIFSTRDGGWTTYSDLAFISANVEQVRVNQHDKRVTITRAGADAGWTCSVEGKTR